MILCTRSLIVTPALLLLFAAGTNSLYAEETKELERVKIFGRQTLIGRGTCYMGMYSATFERVRREEKKQEEQERSLKFWCKSNSGATPSKYQKIFKQYPVSYAVTFEDKSGLGTLRQISRVPANAEAAALDILRKSPVLTTPPTDLPYERSLIA